MSLSRSVSRHTPAIEGEALGALLRWVGRAVGLDVHPDFCVVAICEDGRTRQAGRAPSTPEGIRALAESFLPTDRVALEASGSCREVARLPERHVDRVIVVSPGDTGISSARAKTDKLDAQTLAALLWKASLRRCGCRMGLAPFRTSSRAYRIETEWHYVTARA